jgi:2,3-bisphosphoglycerate-independent phosphoglycerate mutase
MIKKFEHTVSPLVEAIKEAYSRGEEDETLEPIIITNSSGQPRGRFTNGDYVIFYDIRGEREIEITQSLTDRYFPHFPVNKNLHLNFVTMIDYNPSLDVKVAFPSEGPLRQTLCEVLSKAGICLAKIAESEKAIHVGYFLNGKRNRMFPGEEKIIIPSPHGISSYASTPEMSVKKVAETVIEKIKDPSFQVIIANLANVDVVGHIEDKKAVIKAVESVDQELGKITEVCRNQSVTLLVTADHGTVEEWLYENGTINTGHTNNPVPFILADFSVEDPRVWRLKKEGELPDVAPTLLKLLNLEKPVEMTGNNLLLGMKGKKAAKRKVLLLILDGWGLRDEKNGNLIVEADTKNFDRLWSKFPHSCLQASAEAVGMPSHTVGNSEAGHLHLGAGRRVPLDRVRIDEAIEKGEFYRNKAFLWALEGAKRNHRSLHLLGIVSHYSSHGTINHLQALLRMASQEELKKVFIHALIGRRGEKPESGAAYVAKVQQMCRELSMGELVTVMGRFWALDREENWDRVMKAYRALVFGEGKKFFPGREAD